MFATSSSRWRRDIAWIAAALALCCEPAVATPPQDAQSPPTAVPQDRASCERRYLQELGWRFVPGSGDAVEVHAGSPCDRTSLEAAHAAGDLRVAFPAAQQTDRAPPVADIAALLRHPATLCAYKFRVGAATRAAVDKLVANEGFRFSAVQTGWIGFGAGGAEAKGWTRVHSWGRGYRPDDSGATAIEAFYTQAVRAECGVGRQVAQYATLLELFGAEGFDRAFAREDVLIGTFNTLQAMSNVLLGEHAGAMVADGRARATARMGRQGFAGLPGFIFHVYPKSTLSDLNNQAENFVVYEVDADAAAALREHGGFEWYNERNLELWQLAQGIDRRGRRWFERLLFEHDAARRRWVAPDERAALARIDAILADPFYRGFRVYVHPKGVKPVAYHIARLLDRNPRTPYRIELGLHNVHTTLYERYASHRIDACMAAGAVR